MAIWNRLTAFVTGGAVATAAADAIAPELEPLKQTAWRNAPHRVLDAARAAAVSVRGIPTAVNLKDDAARTGIGSARYELLQELAREYPGTAELLELWRRVDPATGQPIISQTDFTMALRRQGVPDDWIGHLSHLKEQHLDPAVIAVAIVRGIMHDPGFLPVGPPAGSGKVDAFPTSNLDTLHEAAGSGIDRERLFVETAIAGRPMGPESAASATFRGILEHVDYQRAIAEGDVRNEWAEAIFETARQIPSVSDYVNAHLRGWITEAEMNAGTAKHGMSAADTHLLFLRTGRPAAPGQMATAAARGIDGPDGTPMNRTQFLKGIAESDIRPEWGPMLWESRFLYPPLFQLTRLVQGGVIDAATAADWATKDRYPPEVVDALRGYWESPTASKADTHLAKAQTQLWTTTHRSFLDGESDDQTASGALAAAGVTSQTIPAVISLWTHERDLIRKQLTPAQVKKAYVKAVVNEQTGQPWTRDDALSGLLERGYSHADANTFLDE